MNEIETFYTIIAYLQASSEQQVSENSKTSEQLNSYVQIT